MAVKYYCDNCEKDITNNRIDIGFSLRRGAKHLHPLMTNVSGEKMLCVDCAKVMLGRIVTDTVEAVERRQREVQELLNKEKTLDSNIDELNLSVRAYNCLRRASLNTLGQLLQCTDADFMCVRNLGRKAMEEVKDTISKYRYLLEEDSNGEN